MEFDTTSPSAPESTPTPSPTPQAPAPAGLDLDALAARLAAQYEGKFKEAIESRQQAKQKAKTFEEQYKELSSKYEESQAMLKDIEKKIRTEERKRASITMKLGSVAHDPEDILSLYGEALMKAEDLDAAVAEISAKKPHLFKAQAASSDKDKEPASKPQQGLVPAHVPIAPSGATAPSGMDPSTANIFKSLGMDPNRARRLEIRKK